VIEQIAAAVHAYAAAVAEDLPDLDTDQRTSRTPLPCR
jgi:hypothetical protein